MSFSAQQTFTRRGFLAGLAASFALPASNVIVAKQYEPITPINIGHGLEIRDYRLFPTDDVMRFIVEIHNTTDTAVDTPTVGVTLPHLEELKNFGWANPVGSVIQPGTSEMLIGVAPQAVRSDDWGEAEWVLCDTVQSTEAESLAQWEIEFTHQLEILDSTHARAHFSVKNHGTTRARSVMILGMVRDSNGRVCGTTLPSSVQLIQPGDSDQQLVNIIPAAEYRTNPFVLIDTVDGIDASFSLQPRASAINRGCSPAMPWSN